MESSFSLKTILTISLFLFFLTPQSSLAIKVPFHPQDLLPLLPRQVSWPILNYLNGAVDLLPTFVGAASSFNDTGEWKGACFYENRAWMEFHNKTGSEFGGGTLHLEVSKAHSWTCMDIYVFATPYRVTWDYYFISREHTLEFKEWDSKAEYEYVKRRGVSIFLMQAGMLGTLSALWDVFPLFTNTGWGENSNIGFLEKHMGATFEQRPQPWVTNISVDDIHSGDFLAISKIRGRWGGFETLEKWVSGAYAGHTAVCLKDSEGKLWVGESGHENEQGEDIIAVLPWDEWWEFELNKDDSNPHIALLPLHPDVRAKFNETAAWESFVWTAVSYQLKDNLKLSPSASQFVSSIAFFPWSIKPLYGILSDCIPIKGRKRIPYLVIATFLSLVPWPMLGIDSNLRSSQWHFTVLLTVQNLGSAMADVVVDAMIAEAVRSERASFAGDLQSLSWFSMAVGGIWGSLLGGYALTNLQIDKIFLLFSVLPAIQLLSCGLVEENSADSKISHESAYSSNSHPMNGNGDVLDKDNILLKKSSASVTRRKKSQKNGNKRASMRTKSLIPEKGDYLVSRWFHSLKTATYSLLRAFRQPVILRPMAWFFLAHITVPNLSTVMFYYKTEVLNLDASFLGTARVVGWLGLMLGTFMYNRYLKTMKLRKILLLAHVGLSLLTLLDIILVSRVNLAYGVSDRIMVVWGSALADAVNQFKFMPFLILSGQLCPPGIEGTLFALFMSINNLGSTLGSFVGAGLASILNLSSGSFDNLGLGIAIQVVCTYIPIAFLFLIPKEATGISA